MKALVSDWCRKGCESRCDLKSYTDHSGSVGLENISCFRISRVEIWEGWTKVLFSTDLGAGVPMLCTVSWLHHNWAAPGVVASTSPSRTSGLRPETLVV